MKKLNVSQVADATAVVSTTSYLFNADWVKVSSAQVVWTSTTASATVSLQQSLDGVTYTDFVAGQAIANNSGSVVWNVGLSDSPFWRVLLTFTSGSVTTLKAFVSNSIR